MTFKEAWEDKEYNTWLIENRGILLVSYTITIGGSLIKSVVNIGLLAQPWVSLEVNENLPIEFLEVFLD